MGDNFAEQTSCSVLFARSVVSELAQCSLMGNRSPAFTSLARESLARRFNVGYTLYVAFKSRATFLKRETII